MAAAVPATSSSAIAVEAMAMTAIACFQYMYIAESRQLVDCSERQEPSVAAKAE